jgi:hypothetical protein
MPTFTVHALSESTTDEARRSRGAVPAVAGDGPYPVRCCLSDAPDAHGVILTSVMPFWGESPYAAAGPVYVHAERCTGHAERVRCRRCSAAACSRFGPMTARTC